MKIHVGEIARELRKTAGLTQRAAADALGVSYVHLCNIENGKSAPSASLLDRCRDLWGVDLYVLAWCRHGDVGNLPTQMRQAASELSKGWQERIETLAETSRE